VAVEEFHGALGSSVVPGPVRGLVEKRAGV